MKQEPNSRDLGIFRIQAGEQVKQTTNEQLALERFARKHERHLKFLRHSPPEHRWIPFAEDVPRHEIRDAVIGFVIFAGLIGALLTAPWWLM